MNWRILTFGLIISMASYFSGANIGHRFTLEAKQSNLELMRPTLDKAIEKATNQITNEIKIDKIKKTDSIRIIMNPSNTQKLINRSIPDTICLEISNLTKRQRRVMNLD